MRGLNGRVAVVTGGARGLGKAAAERLAEEGANIGILDLRDDEARTVASALGGVAAKCATTDEVQLADGMSLVAARFGGVKMEQQDSRLKTAGDCFHRWISELQNTVAFLRVLHKPDLSSGCGAGWMCRPLDDRRLG